MKIVVVAPHNDDEILGVGGTMAKLSKQGHEVIVCEVTAGDLDNEIVQLQKKEAVASHKLMGIRDTIFMNLPVVGLKEMRTAEINRNFLNIMTELSPEIVFIPHKGDMHIDHRMVVDAIMVALRPVSSPNLKAIYAYETLSETEWNTPSVDNVFIPTVYVDITNEIDTKIDAMRYHKSQLCEYPHPRSLEAIEALAKHRGSTICRKYAEAFMSIRQVF
ncbi:PIG-L family deacetylase [Lachnospiraceae bacterium WCA-9-b2]|uniref:PIG-L family deacetylase n=2 Tax=Sporofaciens musculi TaxID=2681861 RepID=A0A7X3MG35_9FIRM|nr:PIG-L family deacetylase [Sporofaciens musculi]